MYRTTQQHNTESRCNLTSLVHHQKLKCNVSSVSYTWWHVQAAVPEAKSLNQIRFISIVQNHNHTTSIQERTDEKPFNWDIKKETLSRATEEKRHRLVSGTSQLAWRGLVSTSSLCVVRSPDNVAQQLTNAPLWSSLRGRRAGESKPEEAVVVYLYRKILCRQFCLVVYVRPAQCVCRAVVSVVSESVWSWITFSEE